MTYSSTCRLAAIADRNQFPLKDLLVTGGLLTGFFATAGFVMSLMF